MTCCCCCIWCVVESFFVLWADFVGVTVVTLIAVGEVDVDDDEADPGVEALLENELWKLLGLGLVIMMRG